MKLLTLITLFLFSLNLFSQSDTKEYKSLFWEISGNGVKKTSYIYGTFHTRDQRVFNFSKPVKKAFKKAKIVALELNLNDVDKEAMLSAMLMDSNLTLNDLFTEQEYEKINRFFKDSLHMPLFLMNRMQPLLIAQMVTVRQLNSERENALDMYWMKEGKKQKKEVVGLETMKEQIETIKTIPVEEQAKELLKAVENYGQKDNEIDMEDALSIYLSGDLDSLMKYTENYYSDNDSQNNFNENFIYSRNIKMADRVEPYLKKGRVFIAVGAAHLPGDKGIIELLRAKGYKVEPL